MKVLSKYAKRLTPVAMAFALVAGQAAAASAAPNTIKVTPNNPVKSATGVQYDINWTGYQTGAVVKCIQLVFTTNADGATTGIPAGMALGSATYVAGTYQTGTGGAWSIDVTNAATGIVLLTNATATTAPGAGPTTLSVGNVTNSSAGTAFFVGITTTSNYNAAGHDCTGGTTRDPLSVSAAVNTDATTVSVIVDPSFSFTVANQAGACKGETGYGTGTGAASTSTAITFGHISSSTQAAEGQAFTVTGNEAKGFTVYVKGAAASGNFTSGGHTWTDISPGTYPAGTAIGGGETFGYTFNDSTASSSTTNPTGTQLVLLDNTSRQVMGSGSSSGGSGCISFVAKSSSTPAGSYSTTISYAAVPAF